MSHRICTPSQQQAHHGRNTPGAASNAFAGVKRKRDTEAHSAQQDVMLGPSKLMRKKKAAVGRSTATFVDLTGGDDDSTYTVDPPQKGGKGPKASPKSSAEKRLRRYRAKAPQSFADYYYRATTQRMFVLDRHRGTAVDCPHGTANCPAETMELAGTTGNVYSITITHKPTCTCPNFAKGNPQCKHIIYALVKVLKAPAELQYQLAFLTSELDEIFANAGPLPAETVHECDKDGKRHAVEGDCAICCEDMKPEAEEIVWCMAACGNNLHKSCFEQWAATKRDGAVTCPYCRTLWQHEGGDLKTLSKKGRMGSDGYVNVASHLGISGSRDYSSYHQPWVNQQIRRGLLTDLDEAW